MTKKELFNRRFENQQWVLLAVILLVGVLQLILSKNALQGELWGVVATTWFWLAVAVPILHQLYVWWVWRWELYSESFSQRFGMETSFKIYTIGFSILFGSRLVSIIILAFASQNSLSFAPWIAYLLTAIFAPLVVYLFYSVHRYFGMDRAYGIDHFDREYDKPFEKKGIFKYTNNGMYTIGFLILYIPGLLLFSWPALLVALFNHCYIWVHYYTTEQVDMRVIYGSSPSDSEEKK